MMIDIEKGKTLIIRLMAVGPVIEGRAQRDVWFEVNGEVRIACTDGNDVTLNSRRSARSLLRIRTQLSRRYRVKGPRMILALSVRQCLALWSRCV